MNGMKKNIDILIINNCPSFYKINLYNELSKRCRIHVVFIALTNQVVIDKDFNSHSLFSYELISNIQIEKRKKLRSVLRLIKICRSYNFSKIIYGGYIDIEEQMLIWLTAKQKNCLQFESSIKESKTTGIHRIIKKIILSRFSSALPPGKLQTAVIEALNYRGSIIETKGVGLFNKSVARRLNVTKNEEIKYLFVGRLIPLKNIELLIDVFNRNGKQLTIVGTGELEQSLKEKSGANIFFRGFIDNEKIHEIYQLHEVFILPSFSEPWGLVVEEAIYHGLPVLVSNAVGCQFDMVLKPETGLIFDPYSAKSLEQAIDEIENKYAFFKKNCSDFDFDKRDNEQLKSYLNLV